MGASAECLSGAKGGARGLRREMRAILNWRGSAARGCARRSGKGVMTTPGPQRRKVGVSSGTLKSAPPSTEEWVDQWTELADRTAEDPLALPLVQQRKRVVIVRHGQSTWNVQGRMQGSTDNAELTQKGKGQAQVTKKLLESASFGTSFVSPLKRAQTTAEIVWSGSAEKPEVLSSLREIDLYSYQGALKSDAEKSDPQMYTLWKNHPAQFEIDGHFPVRELWHRASRIWQKVLNSASTNILVVAHNAINQALVCTSIGLPVDYFRRLTQSNGAVTVVDFIPSASSRVPKVVIDRLNQAPSTPSWAKHSEKQRGTKFVLIRHASTDSTDAGRVLGTLDENCNKKGKKQVQKICGFLKDLRIDKVISSPTKRGVQTGYELAKSQTHKDVEVALKEELLNIDMGEWQGKSAQSVRGQPPPRDAETLESLWTRTGTAWQDIIQQSAMDEDKCVVVVAHAAVHAALICHALELSPESTSLFRLYPGSISVVDFPQGVLNGPGNVVCTNSMSHLEEVTSITDYEEEDDDDVCNWDGCF